MYNATLEWEKADDKAQARELEIESWQMEIWAEAREVGLESDLNYYVTFCPSRITLKCLEALRALGATY